MKKEIKDYLHLYLGQQIQSWWGNIVEIETILGVVEDKIILSIDDDNIESSIDIGFKQKKGKEVKLFLRPLSDMTEEEEINVSNIIGSITATSFIEAWTYKTKYLIDIHKYHELFLYLLKQGFGIFNLIPEGLALDKTLIK